MHTASQQPPVAGPQLHRCYGPVQVWLGPYARGQRGETFAAEVLAATLGNGAARIERDARGRPQLHGEFARFDVNWSHSGELLLLALGESVEVGVDVEFLRPRPRAMELAQRFFHPDETARLLALPEEAQAPAFVRLWCAKEAILKAHGHGISFGLERLVLAEHDGALRLLACDPELGEPSDWRLHEWEPQAGYRAVLAWRRR